MERSESYQRESGEDYRGERSATSDLAVDGAALVAEAALPFAQLLLRRRLWLQEALHRLHMIPLSTLGWRVESKTRS